MIIDGVNIGSSEQLEAAIQGMSEENKKAFRALYYGEVSYRYIKVANLARLQTEMSALPFYGDVVRVESSESSVTVVFYRNLTEFEEDQLQQAITNHQSQIPQEVVSERIRNAMEFGKSIIVEFGTVNVLSGKSTSEISQILTMCQNLTMLLLTGSLYTAIDAINALPESPLIPEATKTYFRNKIEDYLGLPRT